MARQLLGAVSAVGSKHPFLFGCGVSALKTSSSDLATQCWLEGKDLQSIDKRRNFVFFLWGALYLGGVQYGIYVKLFGERLFPSAASFAAKPIREKLTDRHGQLVVLKQIFLDQAIHHPFVLFPAFYQVKEFVEGGTCRAAWQKCMKNWYEDCITCWKVWVPAFAINFSFCPLWMRVPFTAGVSFFFTCLLSSKRGAPEALDEAPEDSHGFSAPKGGKSVI